PVPSLSNLAPSSAADSTTPSGTASSAQPKPTIDNTTNHLRITVSFLREPRESHTASQVVRLGICSALSIKPWLLDLFDDGVEAHPGLVVEPVLDAVALVRGKPTAQLAHLVAFHIAVLAALDVVAAEG